MALVSTVGHGVLDESAFAELVSAGGIGEVIDVRARPGSRRNPQFDAAAMSRWLPEAGVAYSWFPALGGRREPVPGSPHIALTDLAMQAYADHMQTPQFAAAIAQLLDDSRRAVMCSEGHWSRCHRRLLADHLVLVRDVEVRHLHHDGTIERHTPSRSARLADGRVVYDVGVTPQLLDPESGVH